MQSQSGRFTNTSVSAEWIRLNDRLSFNCLLSLSLSRSNWVSNIYFDLTKNLIPSNVSSQQHYSILREIIFLRTFDIQIHNNVSKSGYKLRGLIFFLPPPLINIATFYDYARYHRIIPCSNNQ